MIELTDNELLLLDGKCSADVQAEVDNAKARKAVTASLGDLEESLAKFVGSVVVRATKDGRLRFQFKSLRYCEVCGKTGGYATHKRSGRWHRKGDKNTSKPLSFGGVDLAHAFVQMEGHAVLGCCRDCFTKATPHLQIALAEVRAEIPEQITGVTPRFKRYDNRKCQCGWTGHEGEMGLLPSLMGGNYHGKCPSCGAENLPFGGRKIEFTEGFTIVETKEPTHA